MKFQLEISLDNAEAEDLGVSNALSVYLFAAAERCMEGHTDAGIVWDGNGNKIGKWIIKDDPMESADLAETLSTLRTWVANVAIDGASPEENREAEAAKLFSVLDQGGHIKA